MTEESDMKFPKHDGGLHLVHNEHKSDYETVEQWAENNIERDAGWCVWVSDEQRQKAINTDSVWSLQWYPDTPVGFCALAAADLDVLLDAANE